MKLTFLVLLMGISLIVLAQQKTPVYLDVSKPIEDRVESALSLMTTEEKVALCHAQSKFSSKGVPRLGIPEVWTADGPHGIREEAFWDEWGGAGWTNDSCTAFPALTSLAASFNPELSKLYGRSVGEEARYRNKGVQEAGVSACVKHFALNNQEEWRGHIHVNISDRALYEIYLPAFKAAVAEGNVWSIMGAYNQFRGEQCCHKLPFSFPKKLEDNGAHYFGALSYPGDSINQYYKEDILVGYRWFDTKKITPLFPFGYGLSYTTFEYSHIKADRSKVSADGNVKITFKLTNIGKTPGAEVAQLYVSKPKSSVDRALKELKGFSKVFLQAGESQTVTIEVPAGSFAYYNEVKIDWELEPGSYTVMIGSSSRDIKGSTVVRVTEN